MKILVMGGTGAMGTPLVQKFANLGHEVYVTTRNAQKLEENTSQISYLIGDAHNIEFIAQVIRNDRYDIIIDFMNYKTVEFRARVDLLLNGTDRYVFLSSARVYAESGQALSEESCRLLDVSDDLRYLDTDDYALSKAREEDLLTNSSKKNWVVIRPYISYNEERLQLGTLEAKYWIWRALKGKTIVISKRTAEALTTLTYGGDVAEIIVDLVLSKNCEGEIFQITNRQSITWNEVLNIYLDTFEKIEGFRPKVKLIDDWIGLSIIRDNYYQFIYDRFFDRCFDSDKVDTTIGKQLSYTDVEEGLSACLTSFLQNYSNRLSPRWDFEGYADHLTGEWMKFSDIQGKKNMLKYLLWRLIPKVMIIRLKGMNVKY